MKDEIKEIKINTIGQLLDYVETEEKANQLIDYITNLQEEVEDLRKDNYAYHQLMKIQNKREYRSKFLKEFQEEFGTNTFPDYDEIYKRYDKVKKENERLKELCDKYEEEHSTEFKIWKDERHQLLDYKLRNEKAKSLTKKEVEDKEFSLMLENYKKIVQIPFEEYQEKTKEEPKENFQYMVHKMANEDIKIFENLELKDKLIKLQEQEIDKYKNVIDKIKEYCKKETIDNREYRDVSYRDGLNNILKLLEEVE